MNRNQGARTFSAEIPQHPDSSLRNDLAGGAGKLRY